MSQGQKNLQMIIKGDHQIALKVWLKSEQGYAITLTNKIIIN